VAEHRVSQGECLSSIAERYGFFWQTLWNHPSNSALRKLRGDPNVLLPGDAVFVPEKRIAEYRRPTGATHRFQRKGVPATLRVQFLSGDAPRANQAFVAEVDGVEHRGTTDGQGVLQLPIRPDARRATVRFEDDEEEYDLLLGTVDPVDALTGVKARLANLGYELPGGVSDLLDEATRDALRAFQARVGLIATGEPDDATRAKLLEIHDHVEDMPPPPDGADEDDGFAP
jgi:hypothetical protein